MKSADGFKIHPTASRWGQGVDSPTLPAQRPGTRPAGLFRKPTGRFHDSCGNATHRVARTPVNEKESEGLSLRPWWYEQAAEVCGQTHSALGRPGTHACHREHGQPLDGSAPDGVAAAEQGPGPSPHAPRKSGWATDLDVELKRADKSSVGLDEAAESDTGQQNTACGANGRTPGTSSMRTASLSRHTFQ